MMRTVSCAVNRVSKTGQSIGADEKIPVLEALKAITVYGAYQYHEEAEKGTIEPGKTADFVILDRDPLKTAEDQLADIQILQTIKENQVVFKREA